MKRALDDKDVLLREVHHRVRNNMQLITSLLEVQASACTTPEAKEKLLETSGRVRSIALAQEQLHGAQSVSGFDLGTYLRHLVGSAGGPDGPVAVTVAVDPIPFPLDRAVPTGLIVNELLSNALKHGFPGGRAGTVAVEARRDADGTVTIAVADDGVGLPSAELVDQPRTLGFRLIKRLGTQAGAQIAVSCDGGTRYEVILAPRQA
jgi:two-component sensor histidine kinase